MGVSSLLSGRYRLCGHVIRTISTATPIRPLRGPLRARFYDDANMLPVEAETDEHTDDFGPGVHTAGDTRVNQQLYSIVFVGTLGYQVLVEMPKAPEQLVEVRAA